MGAIIKNIKKQTQEPYCKESSLGRLFSYARPAFYYTQTYPDDGAINYYT